MVDEFSDVVHVSVKEEDEASEDIVIDENIAIILYYLIVKQNFQYIMLYTQEFSICLHLIKSILSGRYIWRILAILEYDMDEI